MNHLESVLRSAVRDLEASGARFALVGGLAVSARAEPRFTRDVDLAIAVPGDAAAEALVAGLRTRGYVPVASVEQEAVGRLAQVRTVPGGEPEGGAIVDLRFASSGIEQEIVDAAVSLEILPGLRVPVATMGHLLAVKVLARDDRTRPQDRVDLLALLRRAGPGDVDVAEKGLSLIQQRGYARGRRLTEEFASLRREPGSP
jgi:predicted nucleotidyltransferase